MFGSDIRFVLDRPEVPRRLNEEALRAYLVPGFEDTASTFYEGIRRLRPAHTLTVDTSGARERRYWALDPARELRLSSSAEYAEQFSTVFGEAVRCRADSANVGALLSGGLDSSSIVCTAAPLIERRRPSVHSGPAELKLWPDSGRALGCSPESGRPLRSGLAKRAWTPARAACSLPDPRAFPIARVYVLDSADACAESRAGSADAFTELVRHSYLAPLFLAGGMGREHFMQCAALAATGLVRRLAYRRRFTDPPDVAAYVEQELARA